MFLFRDFSFFVFLYDLLRDLIAFIDQAYFNPSSSWSLKDIPDLSGKVFLVTGATNGLGKRTAEILLRRNAQVYLAARNPEKASLVVSELFHATGNRAHIIELDLADLASVKAAAASFIRQERKLDVLINNAGLMMPSPSVVTVQGYDLQFGTNVLGHFYLTKLLFPALLRATDDRSTRARVVNLTSSAHYLGLYNRLDFGTLRPKSPRIRPWTTVFRYIQSKFANLVFSNELNQRYSSQGIISIAVNPGNIRTDLNQHLVWPFNHLIKLLQIYDVDQGVMTQLWAATTADVEDLGGKYVGPWCRVLEPQRESLDNVVGRDLWQWMEDQVATYE